jgi:hypothetical protein
MLWKCSHVAQTPSQTSRVQVGTEVRLRGMGVLAIDQRCLFRDYRSQCWAEDTSREDPGRA